MISLEKDDNLIRLDNDFNFPKKQPESDTFEYTWPVQVKYILNLLDTIEQSYRESNELEDRMRELAKKRKREDLLDLLENPSIKEHIQKRERSLNKKAFYRLDNAKKIRLEILKCISILQEALDENSTFEHIFQTGMTDNIAIAMSSLDWLSYRIDVKEGTFRIKEEAGLVEVLMVIRSRAARLVKLFKSDQEKHNLNSIMALINNNLNENDKHSLVFRFFDPKVFVTNVDQDLKEKTLALIVHSLKNNLNPRLALSVYSFIAPERKVEYLEMFAKLLSSKNPQDASYLKNLLY